MQRDRVPRPSRCSIVARDLPTPCQQIYEYKQIKTTNRAFELTDLDGREYLAIIHRSHTLSLGSKNPETIIKKDVYVFIRFSLPMSKRSRLPLVSGY